MKLWDKGYEFDRLIEEYTVGNDYILDERLIPYDVLGNMAQAIMLAKIGILKDEELSLVKDGLKEIYKLWEEGRFHIKREDEDVHTKIENYLTEKFGDIGKKIHTGRSRNDQVLLDLRLYMKDALLNMGRDLVEFLKTLLDFSEKYLFVPMPGYTHTRVAMPSSVGLWSHGLYEAMADNVRFLISIYEILDQSPLGSAAGYGVPIPLDRELIADLLGFSKVQKNVIYVQNSRGKFELLVVHLMEQIMIDLSRYAEDLIYFTMPQFGYFSLPLSMLSGSSIMPQKKNPDMLELLRAKTSKISSLAMAISATSSKLPTGYNRDLQLTKEYLFLALDETDASIKVMDKVFSGLSVHEDNLKKDMTKEIFATDYALSMVNDGMPFREAYKRVAKEIDTLSPLDPEEVLRDRTHIGTPGNLEIEKDRNFVEDIGRDITVMQEEFHNRLKVLME